MVGLKTTKTVDRWLAGSVDVSQANVLAVCRELGISVLEKLIKAGFMSENEGVVTEYRPLLRPFGDTQAIEMIEAADIPPHLKRQLLEHLRAQQAEHERQRFAEIERMLAIDRRDGRAVRAHPRGGRRRDLARRQRGHGLDAERRGRGPGRRSGGGACRRTRRGGVIDMGAVW
jgi:hypothetical protein